MTRGTLEDDLPEPDEQPAVMSTWRPAERIAYWAFRADRYEGYRRYAYTQLGSDADAEEATDNAFDSIMGAWPRMLGMGHLDRYAWITGWCRSGTVLQCSPLRGAGVGGMRLVGAGWWSLVVRCRSTETLAM
ncbi:hypothetical protein AB0469_26270 [Streptomyces sp. NPDC093801]|uniref:hypothetical protein n=1 Tax=Streptomyces sp. NPDC093801 TaxID=3155203 RepID=UPI00344EE7D9